MSAEEPQTAASTAAPAEAGSLAGLARLLGWRLQDPLEVERIAAGATNAIRAVAASARESLFDTEPGQFLGVLESLAPGYHLGGPAAPSGPADAGDPLCALAAALASGATTAVVETERALARIEALNPQLNCVLAVQRESALAAAERADRALAAGEAPGLLHGVPLAHKDMYYRPGRVSTCGSRLRADWQAGVRATVLARLDAAGALDIATLHMAEFALGPTGHNAHYGPARNPWDRAHISGGSSSGSAVAVAAGLVPGSLGSDTGGSVRLPAAICGVVGLKPTWGRISRHGSMGISYSVDTPGPLARTARDCARLGAAVAGHDPADPHSSQWPVGDWEAACGRGIEGLRIGVPRNYFYDRATAEIRSLMEASLGALEALGARLVEVTLPAPEHLTELGRAVIYAEATALHEQWLRTQWQDYSPQVRTRAATGLAIPAMSYVQALQLRPRLLRAFVDEVFAHCDVLHAPTLAIPVPSIAETDVGAGAGMWDIIAALVHCTGPVNYLGLPALAVPGGFTRGGLPAGFQLIGRAFDEATLFRVAGAYETVTDWTRRRPPG